MVTKVKRGRSNCTEIDWDEMFDHSTSAREVTEEFAMGVFTGTQWLEGLWYKPSREAAALMLKKFGVKGTRSRAKRWIKELGLVY
jgi:hypothetical protein